MKVEYDKRPTPTESDFQSDIQHLWKHVETELPKKTWRKWRFALSKMQGKWSV